MRIIGYLMLLAFFIPLIVSMLKVLIDDVGWRDAIIGAGLGLLAFGWLFTGMMLAAKN